MFIEEHPPKENPLPNLDKFLTVEREISIYAAEGNIIEELEELANLNTIERKNLLCLRIMHCNNLSTLHGIQQFLGLTQLYASSNNLQRMIGVSGLINIQVLVLTCNEIAVIEGLDEMVCLKKLELGHNRIRALKGIEVLAHEDYSFQVLSIEDNLIVNLTEIKYLQGCMNLKEVNFQIKDGINPICNQKGYLEYITHNLPRLEKLDLELVSLQIEHKSQPPKSSIPETANRISEPRGVHKKPPDRAISNPQYEGTPKQRGKGRMGERSQNYFSPQPQRENENPNMFEEEKERKLTLSPGEVQARKKIKTLLSEKKELAQKFEWNDKFWNRKQENLELDLREIKDDNQKLFNENREVLSNLNKARKRISEVSESECKLQGQIENNSKIIGDMNKQISFLMKTLEESQIENKTLSKNREQENNELSDCKVRITELKEELKRTEIELKDLHDKNILTSNEAIERWMEVQKKHEESLNVINQYNTKQELLQTQISELQTINNNIELEWIRKTEILQSEKEALNNKLQNIKSDTEAKSEFAIEKREHCIKLEFGDNLRELESKFESKLREKEEGNVGLRKRINEIQSQLLGYKDILKVAVRKDEQNEALIDELKDTLQRAAGDIKMERAAHSQAVLKLEKTIQTMSEENYKLKESNSAKDSQMQSNLDKLRKCTTFMTEKEGLHTELETELRTTKEKLVECEEVLKELREKHINLDRDAGDEIEEKQNIIEDLSNRLLTKDKMLDDMSEQIARGKEQLIDLNEEINEMRDAKNKYKDYYADKLNIEYEENERLKNRNLELEARVGDQEEEGERARDRELDLRRQINEQKSLLKQKEEIMEYVEKEVGSIQEQRAIDKKLLDEKANIINELQEINMKTGIQIKQKEEEIQEIKKHFQTNLHAKEIELQSTNKLLAQTQKEVKFLLNEMENKRKQAQDKIKHLTNLFD